MRVFPKNLYLNPGYWGNRMGDVPTMNQAHLSSAKCCHSSGIVRITRLSLFRLCSAVAHSFWQGRAARWSAYDHAISRKRNKLDPARAEKLVFVSWNLRVVYRSQDTDLSVKYRSLAKYCSTWDYHYWGNTQDRSSISHVGTSPTKF
jgi:hypothetical protein